MDIVVESGNCIIAHEAGYQWSMLTNVTCTDEILAKIDPARLAQVPDERIKR